METDRRDFPNVITLFFHCRRCLEELSAMPVALRVSPRDYSSIEVGFTGDGGIQVWCKRHELNVWFSGQRKEE